MSPPNNTASKAVKERLGLWEGPAFSISPDQQSPKRFAIFEGDPVLSFAQRLTARGAEGSISLEPIRGWLRLLLFSRLLRVAVATLIVALLAGWTHRSDTRGICIDRFPSE